MDPPETGGGNPAQELAVRMKRRRGSVLLGRILPRDSLRALRFAQRQGLLLLLVLLIVVFTLLSPYFFNTANFLDIGGLMGVLGVMAIAQTLLIVSGGIDISVGSVAGTCAVMIGLIDDAGANVWIGVLAALGIGAGIGLLNGVITVGLGVDPLVTTLGTYSIFQGLAYVISGTQTLIIDSSSFAFLGSGTIAHLPFSLFLFIVVLAIGIFVERLTRFGRAIYVIGGNIEAARNSGLRIHAIRLVLYVVSGLSGAVAGILVTSQLSSSSPQIGISYLLAVITAVILGGASLRGGRGSLIGTLIAVAILGVLQNGFALLQVSSFAQSIVLGMFLISAVLFDQRLRIMEQRRQGVQV